MTEESPTSVGKGTYVRLSQRTDYPSANHVLDRISCPDAHRGPHPTLDGRSREDD